MSSNVKRQLKLAKTAIIVFGMISLFGDIIYEGARSSIPTYLELLATPAVIVGVAIGLGEFIGYALRLASGYIADATKTYWGLTIIGYGLIISIPLLALAYDWRLALILVIVERLGKAIRTPARDTLISVTTRGIGRGKAFGLHELFDQIGATLGPLLMTLAVYYFSKRQMSPPQQFRMAFMLLVIPYVIMLCVIMGGYLKLRGPTKEALIEARAVERGEKLSRKFYYYSTAVMLNTAGLFHFALILYIATGILKATLWLIPLIYLVIQGVDAVSAPLAGVAYDRYGMGVLRLPFILSILPTFFVMLMYAEEMLSPIAMVLLASVSFGVVLGMQESIYRAAVADLTGISKRGLGYGVFNTMYGLGFLISGAVFGIIIDLAKTRPTYMFYAVIYTLILQLIAIIMLVKATRTKP